MLRVVPCVLMVALLWGCQEAAPDGTSSVDVSAEGTQGKADDKNSAGLCQTDELLLLGSREFKLMLSPERFVGPDPFNAVAAFEAELTDNILSSPELDRDADHVASELTTLKRERTVRFHDTPGDCLLRSSGYVFRERVDALDGDAREVTLKFRSLDRYIAAGPDMASDAEGAASKFEEDIKPPYQSVFSQSTTVPITNDKNLNRLDDPIRLYPGLSELGLDENRETALVSAITIEERAYGDLIVDVGKLTASVRLTLWYLENDLEAPVVAEISFKLESPPEDYPAKTSARAMGLFELMQGMDFWLATDSTTKTSFVYGFDPSFCAP